MEIRELQYEFDEIAHTRHPDSDKQRKIHNLNHILSKHFERVLLGRNQ